MKFKLTLIDLSYNNISSEGVENLNRYMQIKGCNLNKLSLEGLYLGNLTVKKIIDSINKNLSEKLRYINLAKNNITDDIIQHISDCVSGCVYLRNFFIF